MSDITKTDLTNEYDDRLPIKKIINDSARTGELATPEDFTDPDEIYKVMIEKIKTYHPSDDFTLFEKAYHIADDAHKNQKRKSGEPYIEVGGPVSGTKRKIPVGSYERIIELRLQEIFSILREQLDPRTCTPQLESGIVFCGGGAMLAAARKNLEETMRMPVRQGIPAGFSGAMTELENPIRYPRR